MVSFWVNNIASMIHHYLCLSRPTLPSNFRKMTPGFSFKSSSYVMPQIFGGPSHKQIVQKTWPKKQFKRKSWHLEMTTKKRLKQILILFFTLNLALILVMSTFLSKRLSFCVNLFLDLFGESWRNSRKNGYAIQLYSNLDYSWTAYPFFSNFFRILRLTNNTSLWLWQLRMLTVGWVFDWWQSNEADD